MGILLKMLTFAAVVLLILVWWKGLMGPQRSSQHRHASEKAKMTRQATISCRHCGLFIPEKDAVHGRLGDYCSLQHQQLEEQNYPKR